MYVSTDPIPHSVLPPPRLLVDSLLLANIPPMHSYMYIACMYVTGGSGLCWSIVPVTCVAMRWECSAHTVSSLQWLVRSGTGLSVPCTLGGSLTPWLEQSGEVWLSDSLICHHGYQGAGRDGKFNIH